MNSDYSKVDNNRSRSSNLTNVDAPSNLTQIVEMPTMENKETVADGMNGQSQREAIEKKEDEAGKHLPPDLDIKYVRRFFIILFLSNFCVNLDIGILPATTIRFQKELNITTAELGGLGSVVYVGQAIGCICASVALQKVDEKKVIPVGLFFNLLALIWFTQVEQYYSLMISRGLTGLF